MKVAIPIWEDRLSPVLDTASRLLVIEVEGQKESSRFETYLDDQDLLRRCIRMQNLGVEILICGAVSRPYFMGLMATGIHVISGIAGNPEDVLEAYLKGTLSHSRFSMPGCRGNRFRRGFRQAPLEDCHDKGSNREDRNRRQRAKSHMKFFNNSFEEEIK